MRITPFYEMREFDCKDGTPVPVEFHGNVIGLVLGVLHPVRVRRGPIEVMSGFRTRAYNKAHGGAEDSAHLDASAADIFEVGKTDDDEIEALHAAILEMRRARLLPALGGLGRYFKKPGRPHGWVHVDIRRATDGHLRQWIG